MGEDIRVVLAEDSPTVRQYLTSIIDATPDMSIVGVARNGGEAVRMVEDLRPDVISMDINMPEIDGLEATRLIMERTPTPIVVVSDLIEVDVELSLQAIEAGALAVVGKPPHRLNPTFDDKQRQLLNTLRAMAGVKVISRRKLRHLKRVTSEMQVASVTLPDTKLPRPELIAIGASTGGPSALLQLLQNMPPENTVPIVIVQHMPNEFINGLARWLDSVTPLKVTVATDSMMIERGMIVLAPGDVNLTVVRRYNRLVTQFVSDSAESRYTPSVDILFESVATTLGNRAVGVILTGMGDDGAKGLLSMRQAGAYTLVQDETSSTVFGMPRAAIEIGAATKVVPLAVLATKIKKML